MPLIVDFYEERMDTTPIGAMIMMPTTTPISDEWLFCNGGTFSTIDYPDLAALLGSDRVPSMNTNFPRMTSNQTLIDGFGWHSWTTRTPRAGMWTTQNTGSHDHQFGTIKNQYDFGGSYRVMLRNTGPENDYLTNYAGTHNHGNLTGGDTETAPKHIYMAFHIKAK